MIDSAGAEDLRRESGSHRELRIALDHRFDVAALRGVRRVLADAGDVARLDLDFAGVRWLDAAAIRLLADDLAGIEARGARVVVRRLPDGIASQLYRHPLRRFTSEYDDLFTDPDRDHPGFLPSDR